MPARPALRGSPVGRFLAPCVAIAAVLACAAPAEARYYLSLHQAKRVTHRTVSGVSSLRPACRPRDARNTWRNRHRFLWHRWICDWSGSHTNSSSITGTCTGSIYVTGQRGGWRSRPRRAVRCSYPTPPQQPDRTQALLDHAFGYAKQVGDAQIHGGGYYQWRVDPRECTLVQSFEARCTVWLWKRVAVQDTNFLPAGYQIELWREFAFSTEVAPGNYYDEALQTDYGPVDIVCTDAQPSNDPPCS